MAILFAHLSSASRPDRSPNRAKFPKGLAGGRCLFLGLAVAFAFSAANSIAAQSQTSAPASLQSASKTAASASLATTSSITKDGITWTFSAPVPVGQFVNGDYFVVGPVTIISVTPEPTTSAPYLNGSVKNLPTKNGKSGFDSRPNDGSDQSWWFDATLRSYPPIQLSPGDALVSTRSLAKIHSVPEIMRFGDSK